MGNLILNFLQEQGILIVLGLMVLEGILHQWVASRRYRRLRTGLQALAVSNGVAAEPMTESANGSRKRGRRTSRRQEVERSAPEIVAGSEHKAPVRQRYMMEAERVKESPAQPMVHNSSQEGQQVPDSQLLYLKQSLDRIAAGRDQKLEEEPRERRKLTPEQEAIIADILREYLS